MDTIPREEIVKNAANIVSPLTNYENAIRKKIVGNFAAVTTSVTIVAYVVLYAFKIGYFSVFNIPSSCIRVDLRDYLPVLVQISVVSIYLVWYTLFIKVDLAFQRAVFQWMRVCYGFLIIHLLLSMNGFLKRFSGIVELLIVFSIAAGVELLVYLFFKWKGFSDVKKENEAKAIENAVSDLLMYNTVIRSGVFFILIAMIASPLIGKAIASNSSSFQVFSKDDKEYAVIIDYGEKVLAQEAHADNCVINIDISHYLFLSKDGISFKSTTYQEVFRLDSFDSDYPVGTEENEQIDTALERETVSHVEEGDGNEIAASDSNTIEEPNERDSSLTAEIEG